MNNTEIGNNLHLNFCDMIFPHNISNTDISQNQTTDDSNVLLIVFHYTTGIILLATTVCSCFINGSILYVLCIKKRSHLTRINSYIAVVCILDVAVNVLGCPMVISSSFATYWLFGNPMCSYYGFLVTFCGLATILILTLISVDRYIMVVVGAFRGPAINMFSIASILFSLLVSLLLSVFPLIGWNRYTYDGMGTACSPDIKSDDIMSRMYLTTLLILCLVLPFFVMAFCYWKLFKKLKETRGHFHPGNSYANTPLSMMRHRRLNMEMRLLITITCIFGTFLTCWTPYAVSMALSIFYPSAMPRVASSIPSMISKTGSCFTPLAYIGRDVKIRRVVVNMFPCFKQKRPQVTVAFKNGVVYIEKENGSVPKQQTTLTNTAKALIPTISLHSAEITVLSAVQN